MAEDQPASQLDNNLVTQLLTLVKTLQAEVAALKSGATSGSGSQPPLASLSQTNSAVSGKDPLVKWLRSEEGEDSEEQPLSSEEEDDQVFTLSEPGTSFMETAFKSKLNANARRNKWQSWACPTVDGLGLSSYIALSPPPSPKK